MILLGVQKELQTNLTDAEGTLSTGLNSFDSDGYKPGTSTRTNETGNTYVGWSWRGSDSSAVSNTDGTITSTVSANTTSGFSVVTWTGSGSISTVGHGLGTTPVLSIRKLRNTTGDWFVHTTAIDGSMDYLRLNLTNAATNSSLPAFTPTTMGTDDNTNQYVAYVFAPVEGFSKFGSYTGNGSTDGTFVYTGFRPAFVMTKMTSSTGNWMITDSARNTYNLSDLIIMPNNSDIEYSQDGIDMLSNGFKLRASTANRNTNGGTYIYMAFAENPFKNSLAR